MTNYATSSTEIPSLLPAFPSSGQWIYLTKRDPSHDEQLEQWNQILFLNESVFQNTDSLRFNPAPHASQSEAPSGYEASLETPAKPNSDLSPNKPKADPRLVTSLLALLALPDEAREEGFAQPSPDVWRDARSLIRRMFAIAPQEFDVVPCPDGEISIDAARKHGQAMFVVCERDGTVSCWVGTPEKIEERIYGSLEDLPDSFLENALREMSE